MGVGMIMSRSSSFIGALALLSYLAYGYILLALILNDPNPNKKEVAMKTIFSDDENKSSEDGKGSNSSNGSNNNRSK